MPDDKQTPEEKLKLLGERLRDGVKILRPAPKELLDQILKEEQTIKQNKGPKQDTGKKIRRRRRPSM